MPDKKTFDLKFADPKLELEELRKQYYYEQMLIEYERDNYYDEIRNKKISQNLENIHDL